MSGSVYAGIDIGGTKTAVLLFGGPARYPFAGGVSDPAEQGPRRALDLMVAQLRETLGSFGYGSADLKGIGVSCGGPLDRNTGVIQAPPNLWTWTDVPVTSILHSEFGAPCSLENDANAGAVAEHRFGAGKGTRNMVFLTMGTGLGAGIITMAGSMPAPTAWPERSATCGLHAPGRWATTRRDRWKAGPAAPAWHNWPARRWRTPSSEARRPCWPNAPTTPSPRGM